MIQSSGTQEERESPFYKEHQKIAFDYEKLARSFNGEVKGMYNAFLVDLDIQIPQISLSIKVFRQLNFVTLDDTSKEEMYTHECSFGFIIEEHGRHRFLLQKKGGSFFKAFWLPTQKSDAFGKDWLLKTNDLAAFDKMMVHSQTSMDWESLLLKEMSLQKNGHLKATFEKVLDVDSQAKGFIDWYKEISSKK